MFKMKFNTYKNGNKEQQLICHTLMEQHKKYRLTIESKYDDVKESEKIASFLRIAHGTLVSEKPIQLGSIFDSGKHNELTIIECHIETLKICNHFDQVMQDELAKLAGNSQDITEQLSRVMEQLSKDIGCYLEGQQDEDWLLNKSPSAMLEKNSCKEWMVPFIGRVMGAIIGAIIGAVIGTVAMAAMVAGAVALCLPILIMSLFIGLVTGQLAGGGNIIGSGWDLLPYIYPLIGGIVGIFYGSRLGYNCGKRMVGPSLEQEFVRAVFPKPSKFSFLSNINKAKETIKKCEEEFNQVTSQNIYPVVGVAADHIFIASPAR